MMTLFFVHFAGGSKSSFYSFNKIKSDFFRYKFLELPGRGSRSDEDLLENFSDALEDISSQINSFQYDNYALYGHSMGALIVNRIYEKLIRKPMFIVNTGRIRRSFFEKEAPWHTLNENSFIEKLDKLGNYSELMNRFPSLAKALEKTLRADIKSVESHDFNKEKEFKIPCPLLVINGSEEKPSEKDITEWKSEVSGIIEIEVTKGNHFFIFGKERMIMKTIEDFYCRNVALTL